FVDEATPSLGSTGAGPAEIATALADPLPVFASADAPAAERMVAAAETLLAPDQTPLVMLVRARSGNRFEVELPIAPAGTRGWVQVSDVELTSTELRLEVALAEHRLRVHQGGQLLLDEPAALGPERPEPG